MRPLDEMTGADKGKEGAEARVVGPIRGLIGFLPYSFDFTEGSTVTDTIQNFLRRHLNSALAPSVAKRSNRALHQAYLRCVRSYTSLPKQGNKARSYRSCQKVRQRRMVGDKKWTYVASQVAMWRSHMCKAQITGVKLV